MWIYDIPGFVVVLATFCISILSTNTTSMAQQTEGAASVSTMPIWSDNMPAWDAPDAEESDTSTAESRKVAGRRVIRLGNVSAPELHIYPATGSALSETTVVIAPGGGFNILAWDLEGTEVAQWLGSIGVSAVVLKYRVPTGKADQKWLAPVQDIQRSISLVRSGKIAGVGTEKVGVLGFSAGGHASARSLTAKKRFYEPSDEIDQASFRPDFGVLVYPAWLVDKDDETKLIDDIEVDENTAPTFFAHAIDDRVTCLSSIALFTAMKQNKIPSSLHIFSGGGHGFGLREAGLVTDQWPALCASWMKQIGVAR